MTNVPLCEKCAPLLKRPELDTVGKLAAKLCLTCKARVAAAMAATRGPRGAKVARFVEGAIQIGTAGVALAAAAETAGAIVESTLEQIAELIGEPKPKRRKPRRLRKGEEGG